MPSSKSSNIIELRQLLARKFPGVRMSAERPETMANRLPTGLAQIDDLLDGGLPQGGITEVIATGTGSGAMLLLSALLRRAQTRGQMMGIVDGADSLDVTGLELETLSRLLWVRCSDAKSAITAADILLHDGTLPLVAVDLAFCQDLRKIASSTWFRLQRILDHTATSLLVIVPQHLIGNATARLTLTRKFTLGSLDLLRTDLLGRIEAHPVEPALHSATELTAKSA